MGWTYDKLLQFLTAVKMQYNNGYDNAVIMNLYFSLHAHTFTAISIIVKQVNPQHVLDECIAIASILRLQTKFLLKYY